MKKPDTYIFPCKNSGQCRQIYFEQMGFKWETYYSDHGVVHVYSDKEYSQWENRLGSFTCCVKCHLPYNQAEATRINKILGLTIDTSNNEFDDDFLAALNDF